MPDVVSSAGPTASTKSGEGMFPSGVPSLVMGVVAPLESVVDETLWLPCSFMPPATDGAYPPACALELCETIDFAVCRREVKTGIRDRTTNGIIV